MANEFPHGQWVTLQFAAANLSTGATTKLALSSVNAPTNPGFVVPTGWKFAPTFVSGQLSTAPGAGTIILNVTDDGTALAVGPTATLDSSNAVKTGYDEVNDVATVAAGAVVGCNAVVDGDVDAATLDITSQIIGVLLPA